MKILKNNKNSKKLLFYTIFSLISLNLVVCFRSSFLTEKNSLSKKNTITNTLESNKNNESTKENEIENENEYEIIESTDVNDPNKKSNHQRLGSSLLTRVVLYEGSISYLLAANQKLDKTKAMTVKNDDVVKAFKEVFSCKTKLESLKKIKESFDKSFKDGFMALSEMGTFNADGKFSYEIKPEHKGGACEDKKEENPLDKPPEPFSYKGGRGKGKL